MDVNEEILRLYFELNGYMVHTNLKYRVKKPGGPGAEADIDLAVYRRDPEDRAIVEVKGWHTETITKGYLTHPEKKDYRGRIFNFIQKPALDAAAAFFGTGKFRRILVIPKLPTKAASRTAVEAELSARGVEPLVFADVLQTVIKATHPNLYYRDRNGGRNGGRCFPR